MITKTEWVALQKEWFGCKYAAMQPADAVRARCADDAERINALERENARMRDLLCDVISCTVNARTYSDGPCLEKWLRDEIKAALANVPGQPRP